MKLIRPGIDRTRTGHCLLVAFKSTVWLDVTPLRASIDKNYTFTTFFWEFGEKSSEKFNLTNADNFSQFNLLLVG